MENLDEKRLIDSEEQTEDKSFDLSLRPNTLDEFVGQEKIKKNLDIFMQAAKNRSESIEHVLLYGSPGLGKTTLANIIAEEMGVNIRITSGPALERAGDLAAILTNLQPKDILFIDEIHRMNKVIEEVLYPAMEDYALDIIIGKGPSARTLRIDLPQFTIIGATTKVSLLSAPLRDRFGSVYHFAFYEIEDVEKIIKRSAQILNVEIAPEAANEIAKRSRRTPRIANRLLKRVRDYAEVKGNGIINHDICLEALKMLEVDEYGLDHIDRQILETIITKFNGGPVGLSTIAAATAEDMATIQDIYEPFLMQLGFLDRTSRGRMATRNAYDHLGHSLPSDHQQSLLNT